jgi:TRAP-type C4-dicarboxylate transport system substrate-binding protein
MSKYNVFAYPGAFAIEIRDWEKLSYEERERLHEEAEKLRKRYNEAIDKALKDARESF